MREGGVSGSHLCALCGDGIVPRAVAITCSRRMLAPRTKRHSRKFTTDAEAMRGRLRLASLFILSSLASGLPTVPSAQGWSPRSRCHPAPIPHTCCDGGTALAQSHSTRMLLRGGGSQESATSQDRSQESTAAAADAVLGLKVQDVVSGGIVAMAAMALEGRNGGALCAVLLAVLLPIRFVNPSTAVSAALYLQTGFQLHDACKALVLCAPLACLPLSFSDVAAATTPLLMIFFVGSTLLALALLGVCRDVLMPVLTGVDPVPCDSAVSPDIRPSQDPLPIKTRAAAMAAIGGLALVALLLGHDIALVLLVGALTQQLLKFRSLQFLEVPLVAVSVHVAARVLSVLKFGDGAVLLRRLTADSDGAGRYFLQQAGAICAALILKVWAGLSVSLQDVFALAIFASALLTTDVANQINLDPKPIFKRVRVSFAMLARLCTVAACALGFVRFYHSSFHLVCSSCNPFRSFFFARCAAVCALLTICVGGRQFGQKTGMLIDDRMPRWPGLTAGGLLRGGDWFGTVICAMVTHFSTLTDYYVCVCSLSISRSLARSLARPSSRQPLSVYIFRKFEEKYYVVFTSVRARARTHTRRAELCRRQTGAWI